MRVNRFDSISQSYERAQGYLLQREAYHALILGLIDAVSKSPNRFTHPPYFATVEADETTLAVALQTPPRKLLLSQVVCPEAVEVIAFDFYQTQQLPLAGVIGPTIAAYTFAQTWDTLTGQVYQKAMTQPFFQLDGIQFFPQVSGHLQLATHAEQQRLESWCQELIAEALDERKKRRCKESNRAFFTSTKTLYLARSSPCFDSSRR